jgi:hypothetical protein
MALRNLYRVTNTLINLLTQNITKNSSFSITSGKLAMPYR